MSTSQSDQNGVHAVQGFLVTATMLLSSFVIAVVVRFDIGGAADRLGAYEVLWPERWSFFTNLQRDDVEVYRLDGSGEVRALQGEDEKRRERLWGLNRRGEARFGEVQTIAGLVPGEYWQACGAEMVECGRNLRPGLSFGLDVRSPHPDLCGRVLLAVESLALPEPFHLTDPHRRVSHVAVVDLKCER